MIVALRRPMSLDEFLAWERGPELRYEFDGIRPVAMMGGTVELPLAEIYAGIAFVRDDS